jgi:hypothetical protein
MGKAWRHTNCRKMYPLWFALLLWAGVLGVAFAQEKLPRYHARSGSGIVPDGVMRPGEWQGARMEARFSFPWREGKAPRTTFRSRIDGEFFNFFFEVEDSEIVLAPFRRELDVAEGDRVEIFLAGSLTLDAYYCLEVRPDGKVLDYRASYYRKFDDGWDYEGLEVAGRMTTAGYEVEGRIPLKTLKDLQIIDKEGSCFYIGLFRAEFSSSESRSPQINWISWVRPDSLEPDFHIPSALGQFCFRR